MHGLKQHRGIFAVEFAIICVAFVVVLFGTLEAGRFFYTVNALQEAARIGARAAAVCPIDDPALIKRITLYNNRPHLFPIAISANNVSPVYADQFGNVVNPATDFGSVRLVRLDIQGYQYDFIVPGLSSITLRTISAVRPREALGVIPPNGDPTC